MRLGQESYFILIKAVVVPETFIALVIVFSKVIFLLLFCEYDAIHISLVASLSVLWLSVTMTSQYSEHKSLLWDI